jgi:hypothetical protein
MGEHTDKRRNLTLIGILLSIFAVTFLIYRLSPVLADRLETPSYAYFNLLAKSFLNGRLDLPNPPYPPTDLTPYNGKWYVPFPPLAALLMTPWVAIFGGIDTVLFVGILGALNLALVFLMLQGFTAQGWTPLSLKDALWLTALFAFGTVHWYMSTQGSVWFVAQICTVTFIALAVFLAVYHDSPVWAGVALGLAMLGRPNLILTYPLLLGIAFQHAGEKNPAEKRGYVVRWIVSSGVPIACAVFLLLGYNHLRFDNPFDFGYLTAQVDPKVALDLQKYGQFNLAFVWRNIKVMLFSLPIWDSTRNRIAPGGEGLSIWLTTPAFLCIFKAVRKSPVLIGAWVSFGLLLIPLVTYFNTGWYQFGYRFSLDFIIPLFVLLAYAADEGMPKLMKWLILGSILVNAWGTAWFLGLF